MTEQVVCAGCQRKMEIPLSYYRAVHADNSYPTEFFCPICFSKGEEWLTATMRRLHGLHGGESK